MVGRQHAVTIRYRSVTRRGPRQPDRFHQAEALSAGQSFSDSAHHGEVTPDGLSLTAEDVGAHSQHHRTTSLIHISSSPPTRQSVRILFAAS